MAAKNKYYYQSRNKPKLPLFAPPFFIGPKQGTTFWVIVPAHIKGNPVPFFWQINSFFGMHNNKIFPKLLKSLFTFTKKFPSFKIKVLNFYQY
ncbi:hypothetical protein GGTG_11551 [Gaeumannomyces tritici R3-111a-1]|uniref:Uncharacterized protein n=1 Tax=Gaeumannomyces tritici (strain R3-111a-1) TaxID=644352 RepID=J3PDH8_GAET3|nr:hypothetical protein GGTG_11551 [Gaeumannomyces tritici R3-111a-1]EJT70528.1 hypothetical protein GGTG_11551 [Gaeumannomyces tritici R3-111a-1]